MKLIIFPLVIIIGVGIMAQMGVAGGDSSFAPGADLETAYFDVTGHMVCYFNRSACGEAGTLDTFQVIGSFGSNNSVPKWHNGTFPSDAWYPVFDNTGVKINDVKEPEAEFNAWGSMGVVGLVSAICVLGAVLGVKILGIGESDVSLSAIIKGTFFITLWTVLSVLAFDPIVSIPIIGVIIYFSMSVLYGIGVINQIGHPQGD